MNVFSAGYAWKKNWEKNAETYSDHLHLRGHRSVNAVQRVLKHQHIPRLGRHFEAAVALDKDIRRGFAVTHQRVVPGKNAVREQQLEVAVILHFLLECKRVGTRGDRNGNVVFMEMPD